MTEEEIREVQVAMFLMNRPHSYRLTPSQSYQIADLLEKLMIRLIATDKGNT